MMAASLRNQQEAFQELTRASRDKANDSMFTAIKTFNGTNRQIFEDWIDKVDQACRASNRGFRTELFKKSAGAVRQVILSCNKFSDDELVAKLWSCFSHAPTMNEAREELHNMRQMSMNPSPSTCTGGDELCIDLQEFYLAKRDIPM